MRFPACSFGGQCCFMGCFFASVFQCKIIKSKFKSKNIAFLVLFSLGCWSGLAFISASLGISFRLKWMLFYVLGYILGRSRRRGIVVGRTPASLFQKVLRKAFKCSLE